jgi:protein TonB
MSAHLELLEAGGSRLRRWVIAGTLMFSMHAAAGAIALVDWQDEDASDAYEGAFMLELAPVAMAPPTEKVNLAVGPLTEETPASAAVAPMQETKEKSEVETLDEEESPLAPKPEVIVRKTQQDIERPEEKREEELRPEQEAVAQSSTAPQEAKAPPPVEAPPTEKAVAPHHGTSSTPSELEIKWQKAVALHLNKHKRYPPDARDNKEEGIVVVWFSIDRSGKIIEGRLEKSCGSAPLDKEAVEVLNRASPFPRPPSDLADLEFTFTMPVRFHRSRSD